MVALKQNNHTMRVDAELEAAGYNSKTRAKFFNRIWHPYLPRKVSAMQWLILTEGLPVGAWRERLGLPSACQLCIQQTRETLQHAFQECPEITRAWDLFRTTRNMVGLAPAYFSWTEISRGLMTDPPGPSMEEELKWDTAAAYRVTMETPWDILRAHILWAIWCQRVDLAFRNDQFHLGVVLWNAWRNTIYCAMEAYKELFRHKRNEEKRHEAIACFQAVWTAENVFGRIQGDTIRWNLTPNLNFLPRDLGAWMAPPIRINRLSPSPDPEADFMAHPNLGVRIDEFLGEIASNWRPQRSPTSQPRREGSSQVSADIDNEIPQREEVFDHPPLQVQELNSRDTEEQAPDTQDHASGQHTQADDIESKRKGKAQAQEDRVPSINNKPRSRYKTCCRFGPRKVRPGAAPSYTPPPHRATTFRSWDASSRQLPDEGLQELLESPVTLPARVTLEPYAPTRRTPFDHYKTQTPRRQAVNPYRFIQRRLGISEKEFNEQVDKEVDDLLKEIEALRRVHLDDHPHVDLNCHDPTDQVSNTPPVDADRPPLQPITNKITTTGYAKGSTTDREPQPRINQSVTSEKVIPDQERPKLRSRPKTRCRFGPLKVRSPEGPPHRDSFRHWDASSSQLPDEGLQDPPECTVILPARVTLEHAGPSCRTPFDHFKAQVPQAPKADPYRFLQR